MKTDSNVSVIGRASIIRTVSFNIFFHGLYELYECSLEVPIYKVKKKYVTFKLDEPDELLYLNKREN